MIILIMGVSGAGKTLIGKKLADSLQLPFYDADDFHPASNIKKMHNGEPLNDHDRKPWLDGLARDMQQWEHDGGAVLACSALKEHYRDRLSAGPVEIRIVYLKGSGEIIAGRLDRRKGHFFNPALLDSQLEALEEPANAITVSINKTPDEIVGEILDQLR